MSKRKSNQPGVGWASVNWSGYVVQGRKGTYNSITGNWVVPKVRPTKKPTYSSIWIGIDGFNNRHLIQTGTEQDSFNGSAHYYAWWEILPALEQRIPYPVYPGDRMSVSIKKVAEGKWKIKLSNRTRNWTFSRIRSYSGPQKSAEWIVEAPSINERIARLAKYQQTSFDHATVNGLNPKLMPRNGGVMIQYHVQVSTPSVPDKQRDGFSIAYGRKRPSVRTQAKQNLPGKPTLFFKKHTIPL